MFSSNLLSKVQELYDIALRKNLKIATAESCTGGLLSALLTDISGASEIFLCGFVTYSNQAKSALLDVDVKQLAKFGAVSSEVAKAMVLGALQKSGADIAVSITGIAGPDGGTNEKPVGLVYIASANRNNQMIEEKYIFTGNRQEIRLQAAREAVNQLIQLANEY
jgi:nicotinamide-nucleotide amidase